MRTLALTFAVLFLVAGGGLSFAAGLGAREAAAKRQEVVAMEAKARALHVADEAAAARAAGEIDDLTRAAVALFAVGGLALLTLALAVWGKGRFLVGAAALVVVGAGLAFMLSPNFDEQPSSTTDPYLADISTTRQKAVMPLAVAAIGAMTAVGTRRRDPSQV